MELIGAVHVTYQLVGLISFYFSCSMSFQYQCLLLDVFLVFFASINKIYFTLILCYTCKFYVSFHLVRKLLT